MLQRIISIKNVGRFKNCVALGDVTFRRFTLIFAENARGKTTMCAILRSLFTNTPAFIIGRRNTRKRRTAGGSALNRERRRDVSQRVVERGFPGYRGLRWNLRQRQCLCGRPGPDRPSAQSLPRYNWSPGSDAGGQRQ